MKWLKRIFLFVLLLPITALAVVYGGSEWILRGKYTAVPRSITLSADPAVIAEGERLAQVLGCFHGCHGVDMEGDAFFDEDWIGRFVAPNLTYAMQHYSLVELEAIIRQGVLPDGSSVMGMPSDSFSILSDQDLVAVLSFISTYPRHDNDPGASQFGPLARVAILLGEFSPAAQNIGTPRPAGFGSDSDHLGNYLATVTCTECHGLDLSGQQGFTPSLDMARAYSLDDFRKLLTTGVGLGNRDLGLMSFVAENRFKYLTDPEIEALHAYLQSR